NPVHEAKQRALVDEQDSETEDDGNTVGDPNQGRWSSKPTQELDCGSMQTSPEPYAETDRDIHSRGSGGDDALDDPVLLPELDANALKDITKYLASLPLCVYYLSHGWYPTGMENMSDFDHTDPLADTKPALG
ncbi:hypothetical protein FRC08_007494, partial [Ceratobasidium sp. 394]